MILDARGSKRHLTTIRALGSSNWHVCFRTSWCVKYRYTLYKCATPDPRFLGVALHSVGYPTPAPKPASAFAASYIASDQQQTTRKVGRCSPYHSLGIQR